MSPGGPFGSRRRSQGGVKLFFATDIHGSERCFRKFINAGQFYNARWLVMGGDITGKTLVPIERTRHGWKARFGDHQYELETETELAAIEKRIRDAGSYPIVGEYDELVALHSPTDAEALFVDAVVESMRGWVDWAEDRLRGTGIRCFITPGNDDFWEVDDVLMNAEGVEFVDGRIVQLDDTHEMLTTGYSNRTPWDSPRELDEPDLEALLERLYMEVRDPEHLIATIHVPPAETELDKAPAIDAEFRVQMEGRRSKNGGGRLDGSTTLHPGTPASPRFAWPCA